MGTSTPLNHLPPLHPGVKLKTWRLEDAERLEAEEGFTRVRRDVLIRDEYTCRYCSFVTIPQKGAGMSTLLASGYLEVHHLDDDHQNNLPENLLSVCPFCHQVFHLGLAGRLGRARIIYLPVLSQAHLNLLVNCAAVAVVRGGEFKDDALALMQLLEALEGVAASVFCRGVEKPEILASALAGLHRSDPRLYAQRMRALGPLRVLPTPAAFQEAVSYWSKETWFMDSEWEDGWKNIYDHYCKQLLA